MPDNDVTLTATWTKNTYTFSVSEYFNTAGADTSFNKGTTGGSVIIKDSEGNLKETFSYGDIVYLHVTEQPGYDILGWYSKVSDTVVTNTVTGGSGVYTYVIPASNSSLAVKFAIQKYTLTLNVETLNGAENAVGGRTEGAGNYYFGTTIEITATANTGFSFVGWYKDGSFVSKDASITTDSMIEAGLTYTAKFDKTVNEYTLKGIDKLKKLGFIFVFNTARNFEMTEECID